MSRHSICVVAVLAAVAAFVPAAAQSPRATGTGPKSGWVQLFDGKTLNGWRGYKKPDTAGTSWKVENGLLTVPSTGQGDTKGRRDIVSTDTFRQFDLRWEWKIAPGGNSGV